MIISGLQKLSLSDFPGKVAAIIFTQGCNFRCGYCHNKELIPAPAGKEGLIDIAEVFALLHKRTNQLDGLVITGGEPTLQRGLFQFCEQVKGLGFQVKLDTNGSRPQVLGKLVESRLIDFFAMDVKAPLRLYSAITACEINVSAIAESIKIIGDSGVDHLFRTTWDRTVLQDDDIKEIRNLLPESSGFVLQQCK